jgi:SAC3 family protein LENG8/THP3
MLYYFFCDLHTQSNRMLKTITDDERSEGPVKHALDICKAYNMGNYSRFFRLYEEAPNKTGSLIDVFIDKIRILCLQKMTRGFFPTGIQLEFLKRTLGFNSMENLESFLAEIKI